MTDTPDDLVKRLREWAAEKVAIGAVPITTYNHSRKLKIGEGLYRALPELFAHIEALECRVRVLREALEKIEAACPFTPPHPAESEYDFGFQYFNTCDDYALHRANRDASSVGDIARAALAGDAP